MGYLYAAMSEDDASDEDDISITTAMEQYETLVINCIFSTLKLAAGSYIKIWSFPPTAVAIHSKINVAAEDVTTPKYGYYPTHMRKG